MFDNLRQEASASPFFTEEDAPEEVLPKPKPKDGRILGMTAAQRFVIVTMLFFMVCILGAFALIVFNKI